MNPTAAEPHSPEFSVLLVGLQSRERAAATRACGRAAHFLENAAAALAELGADRGSALVCSPEPFRVLRTALAAAARRGRPVATLVLVSAGEEDEAAGLLADGAADVLLRVGAYEKLLAAWLERTRHAAEVSPAEIGRLIRHEINNPLTGVLGNAELILAGGGPVSDDARSRLLTIIQLAVRIRDVLRTLEDRLRRRAPEAHEPPARRSSAPSRFVGKALP